MFLKIGEIDLAEDNLTGKVFGSESQLKVLGRVRDSKDSYGHYLVFCSKCADDPELFGEGLFLSRKDHVKNENIPCGCSGNYNFNKEQYAILCKRRADLLGFNFVGFDDGCKKPTSKSKVILECDIHGEWRTTTIASLINRAGGCPVCKIELIRAANRKPDDEMIAAFFASGVFPNGTKFKRSTRLTRKGKQFYWDVYCPICDTVSQGHLSNLKSGKRPCECSKHNQKEAYINLIEDVDTGLVVALKFGIATNVKFRLTTLNYSTHLKVKQHSVYSFETSAQCKNAERECLQSLECGILSRNEIKQGWTETTWVYNLDKIIEIYERNGGVRIPSDS